MSFWRTYYHIVWSTKNRAHLIQPEIEERLFAYLVRKAAELDTYVYAINGWYDHVHIVASIPPKHAIAEVVKRLKGASSYDLNHNAGLNSEFAWQRGYGILTLGEKQRAFAEAYVQNQKTHHKQQTANAWLEHCNEVDEGPSDKGMVLNDVPAIIREERTVYIFEEEPPF